MPERHWYNRLVHYQYLDEMLYGRRVLEVGCGSGGGAHHLAERAAEVVAIDTASAKLAEARGAYRRRNLHFALAEPDRLDQSDDSFDVVLVPELERWITRGALMPELRRVLKPDGFVLFAVPTENAPNGIEYTDLLEYLSTSFPHVRLLGEIPFHGMIMADFEPDAELEPQLDCSLIDEDELPVAYLALCSERPLTCLGYSVVQVGPEVVDGSRKRLEKALGHARREVDRAQDLVHDLQIELERAQAEVARLRQEQPAAGASEEQSRLRAHCEDLEEQLASAVRDVQRLTVAGRLGEDLRRELAECREQRVEREAELAELKEQLADAERRVLEVNGKARQEATALSRQQREQRETITALRAELGEARRALTGLQQKTRPSGFDRDRTEPQWQIDLTPVEDEPAELPPPPGGDIRATTEQPRGLVNELASVRGRAERLRAQLEDERARAVAAARAEAEAKAVARTAEVRVEAARQSMAEAKALAEQQRQRAEGAERRADTLLGRLEQDAAELSRLHQRLAELQGVRQADQWRMEELTGRLRDAESRLAARADAGSSLAADDDRALQAATADLAERDAELARVQKELMKEQSRHEVQQRRATKAEGQIAQLEVRLKRAEAEAATLSKWAEDLRGELKEAQGRTSPVPPTPEPEVAALRNELDEARQRLEVLDNRCEALMSEVRAGEGRLAASERELELALKAADSQGLKDLRARAEQVRRMEQTIREQRVQLEERESLRAQLREVEQQAAELAATRDELQLLKRRVNDVDGASEELEQLRLQGQRQSEREAQLLAELESLRGASEAGGAGELVRVRERQIEALLDGALLHKEQADALGARVAELSAYAEELREDAARLTDALRQCEQRRDEQAGELERLRAELTDKGRELARVQGLLRRCKGVESQAQA